MKKLAVFVEGHTELSFVEKLINEIGNKNDILINKFELSGGTKCPAIQVAIGENTVDTTKKYQVLLYNSCNDNKVLSHILEHHQRLSLKGYNKIIGLRDLYPESYNKKKERISSILEVLDKNNIDNAKIILAVMEVETWFIAELEHYTNIHEELTLERIKEQLTDLQVIDFEKEIDHPFHLLRDIYRLVGFSYRKSEKHRERTINNIDYEEMYISTRNRCPSLDYFITELDIFFS